MVSDCLGRPVRIRASYILDAGRLYLDQLFLGRETSTAGTSGAGAAPTASSAGAAASGGGMSTMAIGGIAAGVAAGGLAAGVAATHGSDSGSKDCSSSYNQLFTDMD